MTVPREGIDRLRHVQYAFHQRANRRGSERGVVCLWSDGLTFVEFSRFPFSVFFRSQVPAKLHPAGPADPRTRVRVPYADIARIDASYWRDKAFVTTRTGERYCFRGGGEDVIFTFDGWVRALTPVLQAAGHQCIEDAATLYVDPPLDLLARSGEFEVRIRRQRLRRRLFVGAALAIVGSVTAASFLIPDESPADHPDAHALVQVGDCLVEDGPSITKTPCDHLGDRRVFKVFFVSEDSGECADHLPAKRADGSYSFTEFDVGRHSYCVQRLKPPPG